jgi:ubiquinone/menaquinone biosynthesis C-methylase UbiE
MFHPKGPTFFELARQALSSTERGYDLLAPKFDYTPFRTPDVIIDPVMPFIGEPRSIGTALDICCGTGAALEKLRRVCRDEVVGIDISQGMLDVAERRTDSAAGDAKIRCVRGDVLDMPFEDEFDVAVCFGALGHILPKDEQRFIGQIANALKPGGRFLFVTTPMPPFWSRQYLLSRGFNATMHIRNALISPPFIMYYLTFLWPDVRPKLENAHLSVENIDGVWSGRLRKLVLVLATKL